VDPVVGENRPEALAVKGLIGHDGGGHVDGVPGGAVKGQDRLDH
jgi:hypothetical protein